MFIAQDDEIQRLIKRSILNEGILGHIGMAESYRQVENKLISTAKKQSVSLKETSWIETTIPDEEIKEYIKIVLSETRKSDSSI